MRPARSPRHIYIGLALITLAMAACSSMSRTECLAVDWRTIGYEDGVAGYSGDHIARYRKACAKYGVRSDLSLYQSGRAEGLHEYCQPANGYRVGARGASYRGVCPAELEPAFLDSFEAGHHLYTLEARLSHAEAELRAKRRELDKVQHGVVANAAAAASSESSSEERADAVVDTAKLAERAGRLKQQIRELEKDRARYERDLEEYRASQPPIT